MATEKVDILQINTEPSRTSVKDLRKEMKSLKDELLNLDEGTAEYNATLQKAAGIQHQLKEQMEEVNASAMDTGQLLGNAAKAAAGMTGAFQAGTAVMNMFGVESEASVKAIQQMQNVMAITQGFQAIDDGLKGFKRLGLAIKSSALFNKLFTKTVVENTAATAANATAQIVGGKATDVGTKSVWKFNTALLANPVMWLVAGLVALVAGIGALILATNKAEYAQADFNAELEKTKRLQEDLEISQSEEIQMMQARGATEREIMDQRIKDANTNLKNANELVDKLTAIDGVRNEEQQAAYDEALANQKKYAADFRQVGIASAALDVKTTTDANNKKADAIEAANKKALAAKQKQIDDDRALVKAAEEALKNKRQTDLQNALDDENEKYEKQKAAYIRQNKDITELTKQHEADIKKIKDDAAAEALAKQAEVDAAEVENNKKKSEILLAQYDEQVAATELGEQKMLATRMEMLASGQLSQDEFDALNKQDADNKLNDEIENLTALLDAEQLIGDERIAVEEKLAAKKIELSQNVLDQKKADTEAEVALEKGKADNMMKIAGALSGALAGAADLAEEGSKEQKALKISSAIIDGILGGISAYTGMITTIPGPGGIIAGVLAASTVAMSVAASIKKMAAVKVGKGGSGGGGQSIPTIDVAKLAQNQSSVQRVSTTTGASAEQQIQDTRVYVVESDIAATTKKVAVAQAEATY